MITGEIRSKVDKLWDTFWSNGISNPLSVIEQISYLLFIKRLDDQEVIKERQAQRSNKPIENPLYASGQQHCRWSRFKQWDNAEELFRVVRDEAFPFIKDLGRFSGSNAYARHMKDAVFLITSPALLINVIDQVDKLLQLIEGQISQDHSYVDLMGDLYEYMLSKLSIAGQNGQFRTPRHIIKMMVELMAPSPREIICDPACGTGGFLVGAAEYLRKLKDENGMSVLNAPGNRQHFNQEMFHGFDFDATMLRIGSMNLMLHGIEDPKIEARDSLSEDHGGVEEVFSMVLANPPFKGSIEQSSIAKDLTQVVSTTKTELLFIALFLRLLKKGGRGAVIVPDGVLFGSSKAHKSIRQTLVEEHTLEGVISMPSGVFKPYAGVSTAILMFTKTGAGGTDRVWFYDMTADGFSLDDKRQPTEQNDIPDLLQRWKNRNSELKTDRSGKAFFVPKAEIVENQYDLSINRYKEVAYEEVTYEPPKVILGRLKGLMGDVQRELEELEGML